MTAIFISHLPTPSLNLTEERVSFGAVFLNLCEAILSFNKPENLTPQDFYTFSQWGIPPQFDDGDPLMYYAREDDLV